MLLSDLLYSLRRFNIKPMRNIIVYLNNETYDSILDQFKFKYKFGTFYVDYFFIGEFEIRRNSLNHNIGLLEKDWCRINSDVSGDTHQIFTQNEWIIKDIIE